MKIIPLTEGLLGRLAVCAGAVTALLVLALVVGAVLVISRGVPDPWAPAPDSLAAASMELPQEAVQLTGAMVQRPLFWSSRRPVEEVAETEEPRRRGPDPFDKASLVGVFAAGAQAGVILNIDGERIRVPLGNEASDWELISVTPDSALFRNYGDERSAPLERTLKLEHALVAAPAPRPDADDAEADIETQRNTDD